MDVLQSKPRCLASYLFFMSIILVSYTATALVAWRTGRSMRASVTTHLEARTRRAQRDFLRLLRFQALAPLLMYGAPLGLVVAAPLLGLHPNTLCLGATISALPLLSELGVLLMLPGFRRELRRLCRHSWTAAAAGGGRRRSRTDLTQGPPNSSWSSDPDRPTALGPRTAPTGLSIPALAARKQNSCC